MHSKPTIDWHDIHRRLVEIDLANGDVWKEDAEDAERILQARAHALAWEAPVEDESEHFEVIIFQLTYETYAVETRYVREVYPLERFTPLPCTPDFMLGIVNVHGEILSVIDIRKFFDLPEKGLTDLNKVIVLESGHMSFGIVADVIIGIDRIPCATIQSTLPTLTGIRGEYLLGVSATRAVILDALKLLEDEKLVVQEQVGA